MTAVGAAAWLVAAWATYGLPEVQNLWRTVFGALLGSIAFTSIGVAIGSLVSTARSAQGIGMLVFFPSFLLGGAGPPPDAMGGAMKTMSNWIPLTHVIRSIQEPWLGIGHPTDHYLVVGVLALASTAVWLSSTSRADA